MAEKKAQAKKAERKSWGESFPSVKLIEHFTGIVKSGKHHEIPADLSAEEKKALAAFTTFLSKRDSQRDLKKSRNLIEQVRTLKNENQRLSEGLSVDSLKAKFNTKNQKSKKLASSKDIRKGLAAKVMRQTQGK